MWQGDLTSAAMCLEHVHYFMGKESLTDWVLSRPGFPGKRPGEMGGDGVGWGWAGWGSVCCRFLNGSTIFQFLEL